ncbi:MAG: aldolase/citrate lyase family protein [Anaerolineales bacterium]
MAEADKRLEAIIFGGKILPRQLAQSAQKAATELLYARQAVVTACAANDLQAIDIVFIDFKDPEGLRAEAEEERDSVSAANRSSTRIRSGAAQEAFTPSDEAIEYAKRIVESFELVKGKGAYALDGKMIDMPLLKNAQKVLDRARAAGRT